MLFDSTLLFFHTGNVYNFTAGEFVSMAALAAAGSTQSSTINLGNPRDMGVGQGQETPSSRSTSAQRLRLRTRLLHSTSSSRDPRTTFLGPRTLRLARTPPPAMAPVRLCCRWTFRPGLRALVCRFTIGSMRTGPLLLALLSRLERLSVVSFWPAMSSPGLVRSIRLGSLSPNLV